MDRSIAKGAFVEAPKAPRGVGCGGNPLPPGMGLGMDGLDPSPENVSLFYLKMEHFGAVLKLDLTEETRTQLQEEEAIAYGHVTLTNLT